jgi:hypothetical protein
MSESVVRDAIHFDLGTGTILQKVQASKTVSTQTFFLFNLDPLTFWALAPFAPVIDHILPNFWGDTGYRKARRDVYSMAGKMGTGFMSLWESLSATSNYVSQITYYNIDDAEELMDQDYISKDASKALLASMDSAVSSIDRQLEFYGDLNKKMFDLHDLEKAARKNRGDVSGVREKYFKDIFYANPDWFGIPPKIQMKIDKDETAKKLEGVERNKYIWRKYIVPGDTINSIKRPNLWKKIQEVMTALNQAKSKLLSTRTALENKKSTRKIGEYPVILGGEPFVMPATEAFNTMFMRTSRTLGVF